MTSDKEQIALDMWKNGHAQKDIAAALSVSRSLICQLFKKKGVIVEKQVRLKAAIGNKFGKLVVLREAGKDSSNHSMVECLCDCGKTTTVKLEDIYRGQTKSCGCLAVEAIHKRCTTHGRTKTSAYNIWLSMKARCLNPVNADYPDYGGRGITVCPRWMDFSNFLADMGERPRNKSIDRINNDGNYEPGNCKWSTPLEQARNRRPRRKETLL